MVISFCFTCPGSGGFLIHGSKVEVETTGEFEAELEGHLGTDQLLGELQTLSHNSVVHVSYWIQHFQIILINEEQFVYIAELAM